MLSSPSPSPKTSSVSERRRAMSETLEDVRPRALEGVAPQPIESAPPAAAPVARRKRIVIVGGGFGGIAAARALKRSDAEIILIDRRNHHIFQPLLYQVATAVLAPSEIAAPIRQLEAKQKNLSVLLAEVKSINLGARTVETICPGIGIRKFE